MATLVEQLQADSTNPAVLVSTLLRKVKLTAAKLRLGSVADWVQCELAGYTGEVPEYRFLYGRPRVHNPFHGWIPITTDPKFSRIISRWRMLQPISELENLISRDEGPLFMPYPPEIIQTINSMADVPLAQMGLFFDRSALVGIIDSVRNAVLDWSLELENVGILGTDVSFSADELRKASGVSVHIGSFTGTFNSGDAIGPSARITQGGVDASTTVNHGFSFDQLEEAIERGIATRQDREALLELAREMRSHVGTAHFTSLYQRFVAGAATYMTILGPFLPMLSGLLTGAPTG